MNDKIDEFDGNFKQGYANVKIFWTPILARL